MCDCLRLCDETCCELELERICYDEMERESMAYFYESQREIQRYLKRDNPKFCVTAKSGANREKFIMGGRRVKRLPPC